MCLSALDATGSEELSCSLMHHTGTMFPYATCHVPLGFTHVPLGFTQATSPHAQWKDSLCPTRSVHCGAGGEGNCSAHAHGGQQMGHGGL